MDQETPEVKIPMCAFTDDRLTKKTRPVLLALYSLSREGKAVASRKDISDRACIPRPEDISSATKQLEALGWLSKTRKTRSGKMTYKLKVPDLSGPISTTGVPTGKHNRCANGTPPISTTGVPTGKHTLQSLPVSTTGVPTGKHNRCADHTRARARYNYRSKTTQPKTPKPANFDQDINTAEHLLGLNDSLPGKELPQEEARGLEKYPEARKGNVIDLNPHSPWQGKIRGES